MSSNNKFRLSIYTRESPGDPDVAAKLWRSVNNPLVQATRYDSVERTRYPFRSEMSSEAASLFRNERFLFVRGKNDGFLADIASARNKLYLWVFWLNVRAISGQRCSQWLSWFYTLFADIPVLYGSGCYLGEYEAKHARYTQDGVRRGAMGVSDFDLYLPGIYWLTIFGEPLLKGLSRKKLLNLPGTVATEIGKKQIAVRLDEPVVPESMEQRLQKEREIADLLGAEYFFDRDRPDLKYRQVPELSAVIGGGS